MGSCRSASGGPSRSSAARDMRISSFSVSSSSLGIGYSGSLTPGEWPNIYRKSRPSRGRPLAATRCLPTVARYCRSLLTAAINQRARPGRLVGSSQSALPSPQSPVPLPASRFPATPSPRAEPGATRRSPPGNAACTPRAAPPPARATPTIPRYPHGVVSKVARKFPDRRYADRSGHSCRASEISNPPWSVRPTGRRTPRRARSRPRPAPTRARG